MHLIILILIYCGVLAGEGTPYFWGTMPSKYDGKAKFLEPSPLPAISIGFKLAHRVLQIAAGRAHMLLLAGLAFPHFALH